jgi:hypothetical protein
MGNIMQSDKQPIANNSKPRRRFSWELFYYEQVGSRFYLRITPFAIILMLVTALIGITIMEFEFRDHPSQEINTNITVPSPSPYSPERTIIKPAPPGPTPPRIIKQPQATMPKPASTPAPNQNTNEQ